MRAGAIGLTVAIVVVVATACAIRRDWAHHGWWQDEQDAKQFTTELHRFPPTALPQLSPWQSRVAQVSFRCLRPSPADYRELAAECAETADRIEARKAAQLAADRRTARPNTPNRTLPGGREEITIKRCCNGCGRSLGDATEAEMEAAIFGASLPDVRDECGCIKATAR